MAIIIQALHCYAVQDILKDYSQIVLREAWPNMAPFFSEVGLRIYVSASELFVLRP